MTHLVFLLEERSAREMLTGLLPRLLPADISFVCITFEGKQDLEKQLVRRIRHYHPARGPLCGDARSGCR